MVIDSFSHNNLKCFILICNPIVKKKSIISIVIEELLQSIGKDFSTFKS
jgi:hypothetical protein